MYTNMCIHMNAQAHALKHIYNGVCMPHIHTHTCSDASTCPPPTASLTAQRQICTLKPHSRRNVSQHALGSTELGTVQFPGGQALRLCSGSSSLTSDQLQPSAAYQPPRSHHFWPLRLDARPGQASASSAVKLKLRPQKKGRKEEAPF